MKLVARAKLVDSSLCMETFGWVLMKTVNQSKQENLYSSPNWGFLSKLFRTQKGDFSYIIFQVNVLTKSAWNGVYIPAMAINCAIMNCILQFFILRVGVIHYFEAKWLKNYWSKRGHQVEQMIKTRLWTISDSLRTFKYKTTWKVTRKWPKENQNIFFYN